MKPLDYSLFMLAMVEKSNMIALKYFNNQKTKAQYKDDASPVTQADTEIEAFLREEISKNFPNHGILGEESGSENIHAEYCWVIDPIDGTKNFASSIPCFATLIALCHHQKPVLGCISAPAMGKIWIGGQNLPARCNGIPIHSRPTKELNEAWLSYTSSEYFSSDNKNIVADLQKQIKATIYGNDAIAYGLVAEGFLDLVIEEGLKPWDFCALIPVLESAGAFVRDHNGKPITMESDGTIIAAATQDLFHQTHQFWKE